MLEQQNSAVKRIGNVMPVVLGIDAAWTEKGSSGLALLHVANGNRSVLALSSSYAEFLTPGLSGKPTRGTPPDVESILRRAKDIAGVAVDVVAIDMPIARTKFTGRRCADNAVSKAFGASWASTHSPNADRPGVHGERIASAFARAGYPIATDPSEVTVGHVLIEVYPLAALIHLMDVKVRPAYKVSKVARYHRNEKPSLSRHQQINCLLQTWEEILATLGREISLLRFELPARPNRMSELKPYEDQLDALISAWVGACVLEGRAEPFGNNDCAIWVPTKTSCAKQD